MEKETAEKLVKELVRAAYIEYKAYVDAYKLDWGTIPTRDWIRVKLTLDEAKAFLGE